MLSKWIKALRIYFTPRMITMVGLGFSSGFPLLLIFSTLNLWLKDDGISYKAIGLFSLVKLPYSFKWLWSPLLDRLSLPLFGKLGRRRGWALFFQILLAAGIAAVSTVTPAENLHLWQSFVLLSLLHPLLRILCWTLTALKALMPKNKALAWQYILSVTASEQLLPAPGLFGWLPL